MRWNTPAFEVIANPGWRFLATGASQLFCGLFLTAAKTRAPGRFFPLNDELLWFCSPAAFRGEGLTVRISCSFRVDGHCRGGYFICPPLLRRNGTTPLISTSSNGQMPIKRPFTFDPPRSTIGNEMSEMNPNETRVHYKWGTWKGTRPQWIFYKRFSILGSLVK